MKALMLPIALMALAFCSISSVRAVGSDGAANVVRDSDPSMVSGCQYVSDVSGFSDGPRDLGVMFVWVQKAREEAKSAAVTLGATNIVWTGFSIAGSGEITIAVSGRAYKCAGSTN